MKLALFKWSEEAPSGFCHDMGVVLGLPVEKISSLGEEIAKITSVRKWTEKGKDIAQNLECKEEELDNMISALSFVFAKIVSKGVSIEDVKEDLLKLGYEKEKVQAFFRLLQKLSKSTIQTIGTMYAMRRVDDQVEVPEKLVFSIGVTVAEHQGDIIGMMPLLTIEFNIGETKVTFSLTPEIARTFSDSLQNIFKHYDEYISELNKKIGESIIKEVWE